MDVINKIDGFLTEAGVFFLATTDGDQPKCRPLGLKVLIGDKLYFGVSDYKDVYKQLVNNPKTEINACKADGSWLRIYGTVVFEESYDIATAVIAQAPGFSDLYNETTGYKLMMFHLENATAEFRSVMAVEESYNF